MEKGDILITSNSIEKGEIKQTMLDDTNERFQDTTEKVPPLSCDVCQKGEGFRGMNLQICCKCGVCVHEECYGLQNTNTHDKKYLGWECHACRSKLN